MHGYEAHDCTHLARPYAPRGRGQLRALFASRGHSSASGDSPRRPAFREDRDEETWFTTISYWPDIETMTAFTKGDPVKVHHLDRDAEFLIELPERIELHRILVNDPSLR